MLEQAISLKPNSPWIMKVYSVKKKLVCLSEASDSDSSVALEQFYVLIYVKISPLGSFCLSLIIIHLPNKNRKFDVG